MRFRNLLSAFGLIVMAVYSSAEQAPPREESGIEGIITISPARPGPARIDEPGAVPLANARFIVESAKGEVASFTTDNHGRFRLSLPPGHYKVSLQGRKTTIGRFGPFEIDVEPAKMASVQWECDSGMR